jgi:sugar phosphate isomerase/epimerase
MEITGAHDPPPPIDTESTAQVDAALAELGRRADRYGVTVALRSDLSGFDALERAIQQARCPWFGMDLDPVAILRDEWPQDEVFSRLGGLVRHVRARDALRGADRRTQAASIGRGDVNWDALISDLDSAGYRGWITIDPMELTDRIGAAKAGLARLRKPSH